MKYFIDHIGNYLGAWDKGGPAGGIEVPSAPDDARQPWTETGWGPIPKSPDELREEWKNSRAKAVSAIKVKTTSGNTFDGDEISQGRMARAILVLPEGETVSWVLHDNTVIEATASELREALALAGAEQASLWVQST